MLALYKNIKAKREELGLSQEALARLTGYTSRTSIAKIEAGSVDLAQSKIKQFADALHTTPSFLMGWEENLEQANTDVLVDLAVDLDAMNHVEKLLKLDDEAKNAVYNMIDILSAKKKL